MEFPGPSPLVFTVDCRHKCFLSCMSTNPPISPDEHKPNYGARLRYMRFKTRCSNKGTCTQTFQVLSKTRHLGLPPLDAISRAGFLSSPYLEEYQLRKFPGYMPVPGLKKTGQILALRFYGLKIIKCHSNPAHTSMPLSFSSCTRCAVVASLKSCPAASILYTK